MEGITGGEEVLMKPDKHVMQNLAMITQVGISMLAPIVLCVWAGVWLDEHFGWSTTVVLLILTVLSLVLPAIGQLRKKSKAAK